MHIFNYINLNTDVLTSAAKEIRNRPLYIKR